MVPSQDRQDRSYSVILEELGLSREERQSLLHAYIEPSADNLRQGRKIPTKAHFAIADLVRAGYIRVVVTTNFDRLIEGALRDRGVEPTVVSSPDALAGAEPIGHSVCYVLKLHGDYKDSRILNTDEELAAYPREYDQVLDRIFDEYGLIIAGWSGKWDHALRAALLRAPNRRFSTYWVPRGDLDDHAQQLVNHRHALAITAKDADTFFSALSQRVEVLQTSHRRNPAGVELVVTSAKRFLSKPEYRIELDDFVNQQTEDLIRRCEVPELRSAYGATDASGFRKRVALYQSASESVARLAGFLGVGAMALSFLSCWTSCASSSRTLIPFATALSPGWRFGRIQPS